MTALCSGKICTIFPEKGALNFWKSCTIALEYSGNRGKTKIVVKEHFSEKGKTMEELLTDVMLEKAKQTIA